MPKPEYVNVSSRYGAPMGRHTHAAPFAGRIRARRVRLDRGGYDPGGAYWGLGMPLYYVYGADDGEHYVRARSNAQAIAAAIDAIGRE